MNDLYESEGLVAWGKSPVQTKWECMECGSDEIDYVACVWRNGTCARCGGSEFIRKGERKMSEKNEAWQVDCKTEEIYLGLAKLAESNGWALAGTGTAKTGFAWRWLAWKKDVSGWRMYGYSGKPNESFVIPIDEAIRRLEAGPPKQDDRIFVEKTIEDWHEVEFLDDGSVKVGCQTISKEDVAEIARRIERGPVRFGGWRRPQPQEWSH